MSNTSAGDAFGLELQRQIIKLYATNIKFAASYDSIIKVEYFDSELSRAIFTIVRDFFLEYEKELDISTATIKLDEHALKKGWSTKSHGEYLGELKATFQTRIQSEQFITDSLVTFATRQEVHAALIKGAETLETGGPLDDILKRIDSALSVGAGSEEGMNFEEHMPQLLDIYRQKYNTKNLISTGFPSWDKALMGGFGPGELHIVQARPKAGKSSLGVCVGVAALLAGKTVFHISGELSEIDIMMKYNCNLLKMPIPDLLNMPQAAYEFKLKRFEHLKPKLFLRKWTEQTSSMQAPRSWICKIRAKTGLKPDLIIVDYDDCFIPSTGRTEEMYNDSGQVYADMIGMADYFACPILSFAQPGRDAWGLADEGKLIESFHLAHSARKAHKCYSVSSLNFAKDSDLGILYVDLVRRGESGVKVKLKKELHKCLFMEV